MRADRPSGRVTVSYPREHVGCVTIDRPEARNAINPAMAEQIEAAAERLESERGIRAIVLTGSGAKAFSAGADLATVAAGEDRALLRPRGGYLGFTAFPKTKPWIAAVRGNALAGGCELPLACDMIVAADNSRFGLPEVKRGIFAGAGGVFRLPRALPRNIALEIVATGDPMSAERMYQLGLVNRLVGSNEVMGEAHELAQQISVNAPLAVRKSLEVARKAYDGTEEELWKASNEASATVFSSEDAKEGPRAFLEKRAPVWKGR